MRGGGGVEDLKFPGQGYQRNSNWNFQGLIKNEAEFSRATKKNNVEFLGVFVFSLEIPKLSTTILWNFQGQSFVLSEISYGNFKKLCPQPVPLPPSFPVFFLSGIAQCPQNKLLSQKNWKMLNKLSHWNHFCSNG